MDWHFAIPGSAGSTCRLEKSFWLEGGKPFLIALPEGRAVRVVVKGGGMDYLPTVEVDGKPILLGGPAALTSRIRAG